MENHIPTIPLGDLLKDAINLTDIDPILLSSANQTDAPINEPLDDNHFMPNAPVSSNAITTDQYGVLSTLIAMYGDNNYNALCDMLIQWEQKWAIPLFVENYVFVEDVRFMSIQMASDFFFSFPGLLHGVRLSLLRRWNKWMTDNNCHSQAPIPSSSSQNVRNDDNDSNAPPSKRFKLEVKAEGQGAANINSAEMPSLTTILQSTATGPSFYAYHEDHPNEWFSNTIRNKLINEITSYFVRNGIKLTVAASKAYSQQIAAAFPPELADLYHTTNTSGRLTKGIYVTYQNKQKTNKVLIPFSRISYTSHSLLLIHSFA